MMDRRSVLAALADLTRLRIVGLLRHMELSIGELAHVLLQTQPGISRHAKLLIEASICRRRREGSWAFLQLDGSPELEALLAALDRFEDPALERWRLADEARLDAIRAERAEEANAFFNAHAERWEAMEALHAADGDVAAVIEHVLGSDPLGRLVDIGTGQGRMLHLLGHRADRAIGIDRSPEMLRFARSRAAQEGVGRAELRQGDMYALPLDPASADTVVLHQVLHHAQAPGAVIAEAARLLAPRGRLLIVDVAPHHRDDLRQAHGHVRLGFDDAQVRGWAVAAGLDLVRAEALPGGELTVKVWLARRSSSPSSLKAAA